MRVIETPQCDVSTWNCKYRNSFRINYNLQACKLKNLNNSYLSEHGFYLVVHIFGGESQLFVQYFVWSREAE